MCFDGNQLSFFTSADAEVGNLYDDRDGKNYKTVKTGNQWWMAENLNYGSLLNGIIDLSDDGVIQKYCYNNDPANCDIYGGLYNWEEVMDYVLTEGVRGICPSGWHVPTDDEWKLLEITLGMSSAEAEELDWRGSGEVGNKLKSISGWDNNGNGNNTSGFNALSSGRRFSDGSFDFMGNNTSFWTSSESSDARSMRRYLETGQNGVKRNTYYKSHGRSVRCIQGKGSSRPYVTTGNVSNISHSSAVGGGIVIDDGGLSVNERGLCWDTVANPTITDNKSIDGSGKGSFASSMTGLSNNEAYYVRAYATNDFGTGYGNQVTFTTRGGLCDYINGESLSGITTYVDKISPGSTVSWFIGDGYLNQGYALEGSSYGGYIEFTRTFTNPVKMTFWTRSLDPGYPNITPEVTFNEIELSTTMIDGSTEYTSWMKLQVNTIINAGTYKIRINFPHRSMYSNYYIDEIEFWCQ